MRGLPDGTLLHLRDTYPIETAWAPQYVGDELRQVRSGAWHARLAGLRATADAHAAQKNGHHDQAEQKYELAGSYQALHDTYRQREEVFATVMADRTDWEHATRAQRHQAVAADAELRRRHPGQPFPPLRSAEPEPATPAQRDDLTLTPGQPAAETASGSRTSPPGTTRSPTGSRTGRARGSRPKTPTTATSAWRSRPGPAPAPTRSCSPPSPRSRRPRRSSSAPRTATPTGRPDNDGTPVHPEGQEATPMTATSPRHRTERSAGWWPPSSTTAARTACPSPTSITPFSPT